MMRYMIQLIVVPKKLIDAYLGVCSRDTAEA